MSRLLIEQSVRKIAQNTQRTIRKKSIPESKEKVLKPCGFRTFVAAGEGFEPSHTESESAVLPLHKPAIFVRSCRTNRYYYTGKQEFVKGFLKKIIFGKSQALNAHNFSLLILSNFDKPTWPPSCLMVGSLRIFLFCSPCSALLTPSPSEHPLCQSLSFMRSARSPAGTPGT